MKTTLRALLLFAAAHCISVQAASIPYSIQVLGTDLFRIRYDLSTTDLLKNQELAIDFDPAVYDVLANATSPPVIDVLLFQPNDPLGALGRLSALSLVDHPALAGQFLSVDVHTLSAPTDQNFVINQLDQQGTIQAAVAAGITTEIAGDSLLTPEPSTFFVVAILMFIACASPACRRRLTKTR